MHQVVQEVTQAIINRSRLLRDNYLDQMNLDGSQYPQRKTLSCGNLAHGFAACSSEDKSRIRLMNSCNIGIVTAYNDMLSAHHPYAEYPEKIKGFAREVGSSAQVAGGVPAMCDGVTQGMPGMELSLFSRDVIAQATAIALSHQMFDAVACLGICDKIVPGLLIGALRFGHLPTIFIPAGPMSSGMSNAEKHRIRQLYASGEVTREELLEAEAASYHSAGTCTFFGTANSNQLLMEAMGLQLPGSSFVNPGTPMREALIREAVVQLTRITKVSNDYRPIAKVIDERSIVNAMVALLSSGGSTNHTIHLVAIARAAGILINWDDFNHLSQIVPLLARIYPNGDADINHFQAAGGTSYLFSQLLSSGLMHGEANTVVGNNFSDYILEPQLRDGAIKWATGTTHSLDQSVLRSASQPFDAEGGLRLLTGNLGRCIIKVSAVDRSRWKIEAPAVVVEDQNELEAKFKSGELNRDCIIVVRYQGARANGMPELHKLTPILGILQDKGYRVALITDGRMSGASGKVPAAIHLSPEAAAGGPIAKVRDEDIILLDVFNGTLECCVATDVFLTRDAKPAPVNHDRGVGRELYGVFRRNASLPEEGASALFD